MESELGGLISGQPKMKRVHGALTFLHQWGALLVGLVVVGVVVSSMLTTKSELVKVRPAGMEMRVDIDANEPIAESYNCVHDVEFVDYGNSFSGLREKECAALCYGMPNCLVWSHEEESRAKGGEGECLIKYSNYTAVAAPGARSCRQMAHRPVDIKAFMGVAHWQGCYFKTDAPFLLDGAREVAKLGSRTIKLAFNFHEPWNDYPWHSEWPEEEWKSWTPRPVEIAKHPYWRELFEMDFDTFILIVYSNVARNSGPDDWVAWMDPWYWVYKEPTPSQLEDETDQFAELTEHLLREYKGKTFILQMWEGDWTLRQDLAVEQRYNISAQVAKEKADRCVKWLVARQKGVTRGRDIVGDQTSSQVYHAAEVNLVKARLEEMAEKGRSQRVDMVTSVLPRVALDMVSYSAYDAGLASDAAYGGFWEVRGDEDENDDDDEFDDDDGGDDDDEYDDDDDDDDDDAVRRCGS
jgi:hypothetical protein